jgi:hypothetical protein
MIIGIGLAIAVGLFARAIGLDRDRAFYPVVLIVVGSYYVLFATMAGATANALLPEIAFFALFAAAATLGFKSSLWIVVAGLAGHGIFDFVRGGLVPGTGVPTWWPAFCGAYDVTAALFLAALLVFKNRSFKPAWTASAPRR